MKLFITGAEGFIGKQLTSECEKQGFEVTAVDIIKSSEPNHYQADIRSKDIINLIPDDTDAIIHLAGLSRDPDCKDKAYDCFDANVMATLNLIDVAHKKKIKQFIFASSEWVYGECKEDEITDESSFIDITSLKSEYALSKLVSEANLRQKFQHGFCQVTILRFGIIYASREKNWSAVESIFNSVKTKDEVTVGSLKTGRCFIHVSDIASGIIKSVSLDGFNIINLEGDKLITLEDIIETSKKILNKDVNIIEKDPDNMSVRNISNKKAKELLNWEPKIDLEAGLRSLIPTNGKGNHNEYEVPKKLVIDINKSRDRLRSKKPEVYSKLMKYLEAEKEGQTTAMSLLDLAYGFECNFNCPHCCAHVFRGVSSQKQMSVDEIKHIADQADQMGIFIINLIGGEPLIWPDFEKSIAAIDPSRFHISITTNGWMLTPERAKHLAKLGIDKVGISIDSGFEEEHDKFRCKPGSFKRAIEGVKNAKNSGIRTIISTVVTHQNIYTEGFNRLLDLSSELEVGLDMQCATVSGGWRGNMNVLIDEYDAKYLESLRSKYQLLRRDVWSTPGSKGGCPAATRSLYIIPSGDVLPCIFLHISFGNVFEEALPVIREKMLKVREFREFSHLCFAGEDRKFINRYLSKTFDTETLPLDYKEVFMDFQSGGKNE